MASHASHSLPRPPLNPLHHACASLYTASTERTAVMLPSLRNPKPLVSTVLALLIVVAQIVPFLSVATLAGPTTPWDVVQAGSIHWGIVGGLALIWFFVQLFWKAPVESTKLGLAAS